MKYLVYWKLKNQYFMTIEDESGNHYQLSEKYPHIQKVVLTQTNIRRILHTLDSKVDLPDSERIFKRFLNSFREVKDSIKNMFQKIED